MAHHHHHQVHHAHVHANQQQHVLHQSSIDFLAKLTLQSPLDVYDIHEAGWRRAILLAKRDKHEYLVRYIGWDSKWDEWIRASAGRLAPSNSKTASLAYTGFKGPKSADEIASIELGRDWNAARQEGVMCDVLFALHTGQQQRRGGRLGAPLIPMTASPIRRHSTLAGASGESKSIVSQSAPSTPATSPMVRGLSGLGIISPHIGPATSPGLGPLSSPPLYFSAHSHIINMRCSDLLKASLICLPPMVSFEESALPTDGSAPLHRSSSSSVAKSSEEHKSGETGGRSLADQEGAAAASNSSPSNINSILNYTLSEINSPSLALNSSSTPELSSSPPAASRSAPAITEEKGSLDEDDDAPMATLSRSGSFSNGNNVSGYQELHPGVNQYDVCCIPNASIMQNLLTYLYTGDIAMNFLPSIRHVFELAAVAHHFHLERLLDLCALALNRMITQDNFLMSLKLALHFQAKVLNNLDTILSSMADAHQSAMTSIAADVQSSLSSNANAKIHPLMSPLVRVCFEFIMTHWELCWSGYENLLAFQQFPPQVFQMIMRLMPLKHIPNAPFTVIYPIIHPQACNLTAHFKRLYEDRSTETTDFRIIVGDGIDDYVIPCHKAVLACRSEYFRALFRCSFDEGKDNCVRLDPTQHNPASMDALVRFLYFADLKVDPNCGVYLSNCTDFFGLSSNSLEHACQELVSQHHCLKVLKAAWKSSNEGLFKRACKFIDWTALAKLMNGRDSGSSINSHDMDEMELGDAAEVENEAEDAVDDDDDDEDAEEVAEEMEQEADDAVEHDDAVDAGQEVPAAATTTAASTTQTATSSSLSTPQRSRSISSPASPAVDASDIEMWKAIVAEKANPSSNPFSFAKTQPTTNAVKRGRSM